MTTRENRPDAIAKAVSDLTANPRFMAQAREHYDNLDAEPEVEGDFARRRGALEAFVSGAIAATTDLYPAESFIAAQRIIKAL